MQLQSQKGLNFKGLATPVAKWAIFVRQFYSIRNGAKNLKQFRLPCRSQN